jgi:hypothetical protein
MYVLATNWRYFMKKISLMVFLSVLVGALSACSNDLGHSMTGIQVKMVSVVAPPLTTHWPTTGTAINAVPSANVSAEYVFWVFNNSKTPYYGGTWIITVPGRERTHHDGQKIPLMPGETRRVKLSVPRGDVTGTGGSNGNNMHPVDPAGLGLAMWRDIRAHGIEEVSVRISEFDPAMAD